VYFVDNPGDTIVEFENGGIDTVNSSVNYTLAAWVNNLTLTGTTAIFGTGNELDNVIIGNSADNFLEGGFGNDTINGGAGNDSISLTSSSGGGFFQNPGNDSIDGGDGIDRLNFGIGDISTTDAATVNLGAGTYSISGPQGTASGTLANIENVIGSVSDDRITGSSGANALAGGDGNDTLDGGAGNDTFSGFDTDGLDTFMFTVAPGAANADIITTFVSADDQIVLDGSAHASSGASGTFAAGDARFWSSTTGTAHDADDRVIYNTASGELWYDADGSGAGARQLIATLQGAPTLNAVDIAIVNGSGGGGGGGSTINGTANADTLTGTAGNDTINGLGGNDAINASGGADVVDGGAGFDTIQYRTAATGPVIADFGAGTISGGVAGGSVTFSNIERVLAGDFNDQLTGNAGGQNLTGQGGADTLTGAGGIDTLWGGAGNDVFVFREMGTANADRISDWASGADKLQLDDSAFTAIGALGNFAAGDGRFWAAAGATAGHDANDRVIFNSSTGSLYYDADGSGSGAAQLIATVQSGAAVAATDIVVI